MQFKSLSFAAFLSVVCSACIGCGGSNYPTVSGKVTFDGKPVPKIRVVFSPSPTDESAISGPYSSAVTDENGDFSLKTRNGETGAVVGSHKVGFEWSDIRLDVLPLLKQSIKEFPDRKAELQSELDSIQQKLESRPKLTSGLQAVFAVTDEGSREANFELTELEN